MKPQRFGSESAGVALRRRKIQLPREGTNQRFCSLEKFPLVLAVLKEQFCFFPSRMPLNPFSLQLGTPRAPVLQVFQSRAAQVTALKVELFSKCSTPAGQSSAQLCGTRDSQREGFTQNPKGARILSGESTK